MNATHEQATDKLNKLMDIDAFQEEIMSTYESQDRLHEDNALDEMMDRVLKRNRLLKELQQDINMYDRFLKAA